ncbi:MAG: ATP-binding protein [Anaerolineae bacterium]|nr:ATP-binding protein [Anaerolineae bacterium]
MTTNEAILLCEVCGGMGVITRAVPIDHPDFGKSFPCPNCNTAALRRRDSIARMSNLEHFQDKTFATFQTELTYLDERQNAALRIALDRALGFAQQPRGWLLFMGNTGTGKTHLAAAIAHEAVARSIRTIFVTAPDFAGSSARHLCAQCGSQLRPAL